MKKLVFYKCNICGNISIKLVDHGVPMFCCGVKMTELEPNLTEGVVEKHEPVVKITKEIVDVVVGEINHPMTEEHYISLIILETNKGFYVHNLTPNSEPKTIFHLNKDEVFQNAYAYCNLHVLWRN